MTTDAIACRAGTARRSAPVGAALALFAAVASVASPLPAGAEDWATYRNPRFGTTVDYPASIFRQAEPPPANGDGRAWRGDGGRARLAVWGGFNALEHTPDGYMNEIARDADVTYDYERATDRFYVLSGTRGGTIVYQRCNFDGSDPQVLDCFEITYPAAEKARYDAIVTRISRSLRAGKGMERP